MAKRLARLRRKLRNLSEYLFPTPSRFNEYRNPAAWDVTWHAKPRGDTERWCINRGFVLTKAARDV